ncbi:hypothetical protein O0L34_g949 [Tuta absoluta]|nr:hypothetical protein O0L34_g949 [Tuta absoluta]
MGLIIGLIKRLLKLAIYTILFIAVVTLIPNLPPYSKFSSIELEPALPRVGKLQQNEALNNGQKLYENKLKGPEGFVLYNGEVYTGTATGEIFKLSPGGKVSYITKFGEGCEAQSDPGKCGRPLGLAVDETTGQLYVADIYLGIWKVDIKSGKKQQLVSHRKEIEGRKPLFFNSVALSKNGDLYWTESTEFRLDSGFKPYLADPSGRLIHYNAATNKNKVLLDGLWLANGVVVSPDNKFVVVAESNAFRLQKYYIDGPKKGKSEVFLGGLPGAPDNLRALPDGSGFTCSLYLTFAEDEPHIARSLAKTPVIRKFLARILTIIEMPLEFLYKQFPSPVTQQLAQITGMDGIVQKSILPSTAGLLVVDWNGNIVESYYNTDGSIARMSDAIVFQDKLLTGSPHGYDAVGAVPAPALLKKAFASGKPAAQKAAKPVEKKPETITAKPSTTTTTKPPTTTTKPPTTTTKPPTTTTKPPTTTTKPSTTTTKPSTTTTKPPTTTTKPPTTTTSTTKPPTTTTKPPTTTTKPSTTTTKPPTTTTKPPTTTTKQPKQKTKTPEPEIIVERVEKKEQIPIIEEIPSDTMKPTKEKLKVIKKEGPTEIPNPEL